jgi:F-type H+-transporting ATPase subunit delta
MTTPEELLEQAEADVGAEKVARVYAEALLQDAFEANQGPEMFEDLEALVGQVLAASPQLAEFLCGSAVGREQKAEVIKATFEDRAPPLLVNFLHVLNDHDRLALLPAIVPAYRELLEQRLNRTRILVRSAVALTPEQLERIREGARQRYQTEPVLETQVDPNLLGGLVIQVGDWLYDASVRTRLNTLREQLIEKGSHEITSGRDRIGTL